MGAAIPALGYPSRTAAVIGLRDAGHSTGSIARRIGIAEKTVVALEHSAGRRRRAWRPSESLGRTVVIPVDVLDALRPAADARGKSVNALVREIVAAVADDDLVAAVLDDEEC